LRLHHIHGRGRCGVIDLDVKRLFACPSGLVWIWQDSWRRVPSGLIASDVANVPQSAAAKFDRSSVTSTSARAAKAVDALFVSGKTIK
jgi:hypothetical protein